MLIIVLRNWLQARDFKRAWERPRISKLPHSTFAALATCCPSRLTICSFDFVANDFDCNGLSLRKEFLQPILDEPVR